MKVAHVVPALFRKDGGVLGGAERFALELAKAIARRAPTTLFACGPDAESMTDGELRIRVLPVPGFGRGPTAESFSWQLFPALLPYDVIHVHQPHTRLHNLVSLFARLSGKRAFASDLGGGGRNFSRFLPPERLYRAHLHISEYSRRLAGGKPPRHRVILGGVDAARFSPGPADGPREGALFVGRLLPHKGVDYLIEAVDADYPLTLVGQCYDESYYRELRRLAEGKRVRFVPGADDAALVREYRRSSVIVLPSVYTDRNGAYTAVPELLGQTLLEGMACAAAGLATNVASLPEVIEEGVTGFLVPPNDPAALRERLRWLREHPEETERLGRAGRARVERLFTWEQTAERCLEAYVGREVPRPLPGQVVAVRGSASSADRKRST